MMNTILNLNLFSGSDVLDAEIIGELSCSVQSDPVRKKSHIVIIVNDEKSHMSNDCLE